MTSFKINISLFAKALEINWYKTLQKLIGLNALNPLACILYAQDKFEFD